MKENHTYTMPANDWEQIKKDLEDTESFKLREENKSLRDTCFSNELEIERLEGEINDSVDIKSSIKFRYFIFGAVLSCIAITLVHFLDKT